MIVEFDVAGLRMDELKKSPRGTGTKNAKWRLDHTARHGERHESFLIWPIFDRNFNPQMVKSFNFI